MKSKAFIASALLLLSACEAPPAPSQALTSASVSAAPSAAPFTPERVDVQLKAMGTEMRLVSYTTPSLDAAAVRAVMAQGLKESERLAALLTDWTTTSDVGRVNAGAGELVSVAPETLEVVQRGLWAGEVSQGTFDITWNSLGALWRFGDAQEPDPRPPTAAQVRARLPAVDYRKVEVQVTPPAVKVPRGSTLGLGGIAKGYIVDRVAQALETGGLTSFLVQAGGDLYGKGRKPDGTRWVSGIQDPRGDRDRYFATIELEDSAFSTAGDYARSYLYQGKRYHHIIDPRTGFPATACQSVTVWAPTALLADALDDAVFILGVEAGLKLIEATEGAGAVIVDSESRVHVSQRLQGKVKITAQPTPGP
ncbi:MAG: FAD:protein FMN transferase [Polyangiaceae bacterium]|nr:FAD:protein FMN transferase [Polyangiaceae bacterium]MCW5789458.1 FAD:protein FMN transferase [Polyangiaceae bacterium]